MNASAEPMSPPAWRYLLVLLLVTCLGLSGCTSRAKTPADQQQRALNSLKGHTWFDSDKVSYRRPKVSNELDVPTRVSGWEAVSNPITPGTPRRNWGNWNWDFFGLSLSAFVWLGLGLLLAALAMLLAVVSVQSWNPGKQLTKQTQAIEIDPTRVADLPFEAQAEMQDPLEAARRMAGAGDYDGAAQFLYGYMLLALDRAGQIVLHRGKTNRMYMLELSGQRVLRDLLQPAMLAFEDVFFGRKAIERARFTQLWNNLDQFHRELQPAMQGRELTAEVVST